VQAYSPYTRCPAGVALVTAGGEVHWGSYLESAAFNPSLGPLHAALTAAVRAGLPAYDQVGLSAAASPICFTDPNHSPLRQLWASCSAVHWHAPRPPLCAGQVGCPRVYPSV